MSYMIVVDAGAGEIVWKKNVHFKTADKEASLLASKPRFKKVIMIDDIGTITDYKKLVREVSVQESFVKKRMKY